MLSLFHRIGSNLALSLQSATELHVFAHGGGSSGEPFDLGAAPVLFHLQDDPELFEYINGCENNLDNLDYGAVRKSHHSRRVLSFRLRQCECQFVLFMKFLTRLPLLPVQPKAGEADAQRKLQPLRGGKFKYK